MGRVNSKKQASEHGPIAATTGAGSDYSANGNVFCPSARMSNTFSVIATSA